MDDALRSWDDTTRRLVAFARRTRFEDLDAGTHHEAKRHLIDTFASALGAFDEPVCVMSRALAARYRADEEACIWGSDACASAEMAAFANGVMVRALDVSDTYLGRSRGHPSDMISGLIAAAELARADGKTLIEAISVAYDVYCSFCEHVDLNAKGWDQPVYGVLGCALGAAGLLRLSADATAHAVSLALVPNVALAQARRGALSSWKGCAGANASRNALFAVLLARAGFTGPFAPFEGSGGLWEAIGRAEWPLPGEPLISRTHMKRLPVCYHGQSSVEAALDLRAQVNVADIEEIRVETYGAGVFMMGSDPSRWAPETRETADHSLPYCIAVALLDGAVTEASFAPQLLHAPEVRTLMRKVKVAEDRALTDLYPESAPGRVTLIMRSGQRHVAEIRYPRGHVKNPLSDAEIERKFADMSDGKLSIAQRDGILQAIWRLETLADVRDLTKSFAASSARKSQKGRGTS